MYTHIAGTPSKILCAGLCAEIHIKFMSRGHPKFISTKLMSAVYIYIYIY